MLTLSFNLSNRVVSTSQKNHGCRWLVDDAERRMEELACIVNSAHVFYGFPVSPPLFSSLTMAPMTRYLHTFATIYIYENIWLQLHFRITKRRVTSHFSQGQKSTSQATVENRFKTFLIHLRLKQFEHILRLNKHTVFRFSLLSPWWLAKGMGQRCWNGPRC